MIRNPIMAANEGSARFWAGQGALNALPDWCWRPTGERRATEVERPRAVVNIAGMVEKHRQSRGKGGRVLPYDDDDEEEGEAIGAAAAAKACGAAEHKVDEIIYEDDRELQARDFEHFRFDDEDGHLELMGRVESLMRKELPRRMVVTCRMAQALSEFLLNNALSWQTDERHGSCLELLPRCQRMFLAACNVSCLRASLERHVASFNDRTVAFDYPRFVRHALATRGCPPHSSHLRHLSRVSEATIQLLSYFLLFEAYARDVFSDRSLFQSPNDPNGILIPSLPN